ncbi:MAG: 4Fe-4S binding protein [Deltaproteobacteria bacterium]|nr:MAG: 4Fe-4S binding protein [Deltaproteobacteria bacterium]
MSEDVYYKLGERLNEYQVKMLLVEPFFKVLREIYSEEEARLGAEYPAGPHTLKEASELLGRDEKELEPLLEKMANQGTMFTTRDGEVIRYALTPFVPGVVEFQLMRATDTPRDRRMAAAFEELMEGEMGELMRAALQDKETAKQMIPNAPARTVTVEKELPADSEIFPFEKVSELFDQEESFGAAKCYCRHHAYLVNRPCQVKGIPEYSCLMFGKTADYVVERGFGKRITKEEALEITRQCAEAGLVHNVNNFSGGLVFLCNCCGCCCGFLQSIKRFNTDAMVAYSNFMVQINAEECTGCETCIDRCPMEALSLEDDVATVNPELCIGCGNCKSVCPEECMIMVRRSDKKPPKIDKSIVALGV